MFTYTMQIPQILQNVDHLTALYLSYSGNTQRCRPLLECKETLEQVNAHLCEQDLHGAELALNSAKQKLGTLINRPFADHREGTDTDTFLRSGAKVVLASICMLHADVLQAKTEVENHKPQRPEITKC
ncbi:hypothetical protein [Vibrio phage LV6]|nr:hypothetical protein [Vibrio phage LV6]